MNRFLKNSCVLTLAALATASAAAQGMGSGDLTISGFGTLGMARTNTDAAQYVRYNQAEGVTTHAGVGTDSNLGLQATYKFSPTLSATAQVLSRKNTSPTFTTDLTWAFVKAKLSDDFSVRGGKFAVPVFLISEYQNVGYANTMIRPPIELYGQAPLEAVTGVDLTYQHSYGDTTVTGVATVGTSAGKLFVAAGGGSVAHYKAPMKSLGLQVEHGAFTARLAHLRANFSSDDFGVLNNLVKTLGSVGFAQLGQDLSLTSAKTVTFTSLSATMDMNNIVAQLELGIRKAKEPVYIADTKAWIAMLGYRVGKVLPYYAHATVTQSGASVTLPANFPKSGPLYAGVYNGFIQANLQTSDIIGARWDFAKALALKVQFDRVKPQTKNGALIFGPASGMVGQTVNVMSFAIDTVF